MIAESRFGGALEYEDPMGHPAPFIHLRARSAYSLLESTLQVKALAGLCVQNAMPAMALTDSNNLFGALEFCEVFAEKGVQPIVGLSLNVRDNAGGGEVALLGQSEAGYANLMRLSSHAFLDAGAHEPGVPLDLVFDHCEGLIALTGGRLSPVNRLITSGRSEEARRLLERLRQRFGDRLYVELQRQHEPGEAEAEGDLVDFAYEMGLPLVATNDVRFAAASPADHRAHDVLTCIAEGGYVGDDSRQKLSRQHCFKSGEAMAALFADLPEAIASTAEIARRCAYRVETRKPILPRFTTAEGRDEAAELAAQAEAGLKKRLEALGDRAVAPPEDYAKRLAFEVGVIQKMGFSGYFLIVSDFIKWAKAQNIPVGPGRGSGAGSLVAYAMFITDLDPLRYGLLFERFLNPERVSMPDFDIDFCQDRRGEVIDYVTRRYGADRVAQIITFGTLQARAVVRDVGRVLQLPFGQVDRIAKLIPANPANPVTLAQAMEQEPRLREMATHEPEVGELLEIALQLEGLYRNASTHAAGVVIGDRPLSELVALYRDPRADLPATQFNMKWVEPAGLVKFDFLGLKTLTVIERALGFLRQRGIDLDLAAIPIDDPATYQLFAAGATYGVFQLESQGMRDTLRKVKPNCLEDIIALISLYRPGPMGNIDTYADAKFGRMDPDYLHPTLEPILKETYGVIIYQEQVMQIAQVLSGYSLGEADLLRRAMGKKKPEEMAKQKSRFLEGAAARGVGAELAARIFDLVAEFAGYGFNKSHAAAYAVIAYQTAYLKANFPVEFLAASMSLDAANTDKLAMFLQDAKRSGVAVLAPDVQRSCADFSVEDGAIRYALGAVRNVGMAAMQMVEAERKRKPFKDLIDFAERLDPKAINRRQLENLAKAGAFDSLEDDRARALGAAETLAAIAQRVAEERASAQASLFGADEPAARPALPKAAAWSPQDRLDFERESVGFYLSGHPLDQFLAKAESGKYYTFAELLDEGEQPARTLPMIGVLRTFTERMTKEGMRVGIAAFSDPTGDFEAFVMTELLPVAREKLQAGKGYVIKARVRWKDGDLRVGADAFEPIEAAEARAGRDLEILIREGAPIAAIAQTLRALPAAPGDEARRLTLILRLADGRSVAIEAPGQFPAGPAARAALKAVRGVERIN
jgi:DNA polymerase III subunit alpha